MNGLKDLYGRVMSAHEMTDAPDCRVLRIAFSSAEQVRSRRVVTRSSFRPASRWPGVFFVLELDATHENPHQCGSAPSRGRGD
jgi:hypothetical protein